MAQQTVIAASGVAQAINTDVTLFTPAAGIRYKVLSFAVTNEVAAQVAGMDFELRYGNNVLAIAGFGNAAAPIGTTTPVIILAHELIGDGVTPIRFRNLTALNAASQVRAMVSFDGNYAN